ncbi:MAG: hypothetical protein U1E73_11895 [Planctomycetota bacterium]
MKTPGAALFAFLAITCASGIAHAQEESGLQRTRVYDVRDIARREPWFLPATIVDASFVPAVNDTAEEARAALELADLAMLVKEGTGAEYWEQEGVELRPEDSGFLSLTCDEQMHTQVRTVLSRLRRLLFEPVLVEVHELPASTLQKRGSVLSAEEVDALLSQAGEHRVFAGRTNPRMPLLLESKRIQNRIAGLKMLVAQNAKGPDLEVAAANHGASWSVRAARAIGDGMLVTVSGSERSLSAGPVCEVPTGDGNAATLELPVTRIASCSASAYLRPGQAMLVGSDAPGSVVLCVRVQRTVPISPLEIGELTAYPIGNLVGGAARPVDLHVPYEAGTLFPASEDEPMPTVFDGGRLVEWLVSQVDPETWNGSPNTMQSLGGFLFVSAGEATQKGIVERLQSLQALDSRQFTLDVCFGDVPNDIMKGFRGLDVAQLAAALPQHCVATVSASREARVSATFHTPFVKDCEAGIAMGSAATAPVLGSIARGFLLRCNAEPMDQGTALLDLQMSLLSHDAERSLFALKDPRLGQVDRIDVRENKVRGATVVTLGEWTILLLSPVEGGTGHIAVVARLRAA